jgi:hypothetical protein
MWRRVCGWGTLEKLHSVADLLFKITALVAALAAANFFFYQPEIKLTTNAQAFIDMNTLRASYSADRARMPEIVRRAAQEYNRLNESDLITGANSTASRLPAAALCAELPGVVRAVFPESDCESSRVTLGRARYYERLLLRLNADRRPAPLSNARLRESIGRLRSAEFLKARCAISNVGNAKAANVQIRPSDGFFLPGGAANDPFALEPTAGKPVHRTFQSSPGAFDRDPELEFGVDWTRGGLTDTGPVTLVASILLVAFVLVLINDFIRSEQRRRDDASDAADS